MLPGAWAKGGEPAMSSAQAERTQERESEQKQKQKTHVALLGWLGRHMDRDKSKSACKNEHGLLKAAKICHPPVFNAQNCTLSMQFYT